MTMILCKLGIHRYKLESTEDGERFFECKRCGKSKTPSSTAPDTMGGHF